jgi:hypothetical protein
MRLQTCFTVLVLMLFAPMLAVAELPRLGEGAFPGEEPQEADANAVAPTVFVSGGYGSHWLNGDTGKAFYTLPGSGIVEEYELVYEKATSEYYYYHEKGFNDYKWIFARRGMGCYNVYHERPKSASYPFDGLLHCALVTKLTKNATSKRE